MRASFYKRFDTETRNARPQSGDDERSPFQRDRDRVLFTYAFRRLQSKTQVFQSGEYDFYRTRLTHTLEVARIARSIAEAVRRHQPDLPSHPDPDLCEAVGYAHDLGHPPFGHIGERRLNELMAPYGGFEGNAQTLRILTDLIYERRDGPCGMDPTRAFLDGVLKYKALHREFVDEAARHPDPEKRCPPDHHFLYDDQESWRAWTFAGAGARPSNPAAWNAVKSVECQIMDWADDTAYSLHDIVDGVRAGFLTPGGIEAWFDTLEAAKQSDWAPFKKDLLGVIAEERLERHIGSRIGRFIHSCRLVECDGPLATLSNRYRWRLEIDPAVKAESSFKKALAVALIFRSPQIQQVEFRGGRALERLFGALRDHYIEPPKGVRALDILPEPTGSRIRNEEDMRTRARLACDYLSGLTDGQAVRLYQRLFQPGSESLGLLA